MDGFRLVSKILVVPAPVETVLAVLTALDAPSASRSHLVEFQADTVEMGPGTHLTEARRYRGRTARRLLTVDAVVPEGYLAVGHIGSVRCRVALRARGAPGGMTRVMSDLHLEGNDAPARTLARLPPGFMRQEHIFLALVGRDLVTAGRSAVALARASRD